MSNRTFEKTICIKNQRGLHARAAAKFVQITQDYDAEIFVKRGKQEVSGHSIMGLLTLAATIGTEIMVKAMGSEAEKSIIAIENLVDNLFYEEK